MGGGKMDDLAVFLVENVEGYLFEDLETLKRATLGEGKTKGAVGYPLLMTTFAGIELLGSLVSRVPFRPKKGRNRFVEFWRLYLYDQDAERAAAGDALYALARNGLAHVFVGKGDLLVFKDLPDLHLKRVDNSITIDACQLAVDLRIAYDRKIKPRAVLFGDSLRDTMATRLSEMYAEYGIQATNAMPKLQLPVVSYDPSSLLTTSGKAVWSAYSSTRPL